MLSHRKGMGVLLLATLFLAGVLASRPTHAQKAYIKKVENWINWNGMFKAGVDSIQRQAVIDDVTSQIAAVSKKSIVDFYAKPGKITSSLRKYAGNNKNRIYITRMRVDKCNNGDTLFWNVNADAEIHALDSISSQTGSPPPKPVVQPKGGFLDFFAYNNGLNFLVDSVMKAVGAATMLSFPQPVNIDKEAVIAILDSGIDTALFEPGIRTEILWNGTSGSVNMVKGENKNDFMDNFWKKHGTAVASIVLNSYYRSSNNTSLPTLMVVKVLSDKGEGSVFDLCCGINYAVANKATVINASLGYTLEGATRLNDEALEYCLAKCKADSIPLVAAAGNSENDRGAHQLCDQNNTGSNRMTLSNVTLPAAFASQPNRYSVVSVTGMSQPGVPCYYQYYSDEYVSIGVVNDQAETNCCSFKLPFFIRTVEGSSYSTPVVSGRIGYTIAHTGHRATVAEYLQQMNVTNAPRVLGLEQATQANSYISY